MTKLRSNVVVDPESGCWIWQGATRDSGYGRITFEARSWFTHILAYVTVNGPVSNGLVLDHLCRHILCCNPAHLEAVTQRENVRRGYGIASRNATKTRCDNGHEFTPENTYAYKTRGIPTRGCKECRREAVRRRRRLQRAA